MTDQMTTRPSEPSVATLSGSTLPARLRRLFLATRPAFAPASLAPVVVGTAWGASIAGRLLWVPALLAVLATLLVHLGANVLNDVADDLSGADRDNEERIFPYTGGSRFIQNGLLSLPAMTAWGTTLLGAAALLGIVLADLRGAGVIIFGLIGVALAIAYSLPRAQLAARGLGELAIAVAFGILPVTGAAWLQSGRIDAQSLLMSIPVGLWGAAILLMNEVPDRAADARAGKETLVVRWGVAATRRLYLGLQWGACAAFVLAAVLRWIPLWSGLFALALAPAGWRAAGAIGERATRTELTGGIQMTLAIHLAGSALLLASVLCTLLLR